ncbi:hypothetical protein [Geoglobus acetivorans]|uniref:Uncharacterized protein n=1 Tax=Geoglobus acetivorans TaxID=565033 RepID=A0ABZ3H2Q5_GEOAI|nr:hypothetical protein [Geoglobus acetivorans]
MTNWYLGGRIAEKKVAGWLKKPGFIIVARKQEGLLLMFIMVTAEISGLFR